MREQVALRTRTHASTPLPAREYSPAHSLARLRGRSVSSTGSRSSCRTSRSDPTCGAALFSDTRAASTLTAAQALVVRTVGPGPKLRPAQIWKRRLGPPSLPLCLGHTRNDRRDVPTGLATAPSARTARGPPRVYGARADAGAPIGAARCPRAGAASGFQDLPGAVPPAARHGGRHCPRLEARCPRPLDSPVPTLRAGPPCQAAQGQPRQLTHLTQGHVPTGPGFTGRPLEAAECPPCQGGECASLRFKSAATEPRLAKIRRP
jgi:hypothetical protein